MDNNAFSSLVRERIPSESTKDIARSAVQAEFKRKKRKRKGYDGSSDEDDNAKQQKHNKPRQESPKKPHSSKESSEKDNRDEKYRDRAKERRDGKGEVDELDFLDQQSDEFAALTRKREFEEQSTAISSKEPSTFCRNADEAKAYLESKPQASSVLGRDILEYLRSSFGSSNDVSFNVDQNPTPAGLSQHRTLLTFTTIANAGVRDKAWEIPREQTFAGTDVQQIRRGCSLSEDMLQRMEQVFDRRRRLEENAGEDGSNEQAKESKDSDHSEDDDIFGGLQEYDPLANNHDAQAKKKDSLAPNAGKQQRSFFFDQDHGDRQESELNVASTSVQRGKIARLQGFSSSSNRADYGEDMDADYDGRFDDEPEEGKKKSRKKKKRDEDDND